jgi:hypothetical protein
MLLKDDDDIFSGQYTHEKAVDGQKNADATTTMAITVNLIFFWMGCKEVQNVSSSDIDSWQDGYNMYYYGPRSNSS